MRRRTHAAHWPCWRHPAAPCCGAALAWPAAVASPLSKQAATWRSVWRQWVATELLYITSTRVFIARLRNMYMCVQYQWHKHWTARSCFQGCQNYRNSQNSNFKFWQPWPCFHNQKKETNKQTNFKFYTVNFSESEKQVKIPNCLHKIYIGCIFQMLLNNVQNQVLHPLKFGPIKLLMLSHFR